MGLWLTQCGILHPYSQVLHSFLISSQICKHSRSLWPFSPEGHQWESVTCADLKGDSHPSLHQLPVSHSLIHSLMSSKAFIQFGERQLPSPMKLTLLAQLQARVLGSHPVVYFVLGLGFKFRMASPLLFRWGRRALPREGK